MPEVITIQSITQLHAAMGYPKPAHPLISVVDLSQAAFTSNVNQKVTTNLYSISLKTKYTNGTVHYGQNHLDFEEGVLLGLAPQQVMSLEEKIEKGDMEGWSVNFHPDLLGGYALESDISSFHFFEYATHEALHLSEKEIGSLSSVAWKIAEECELNVDDYSNDVLVAQLDLLLNYIKRYYGRQFKTRKSVNSDLLSRFEQLLVQYMNSHQLEEKGLPSISYFAGEFHLTSSYFSDLLKKETGKTAQDHLHNALIKKAKSLLLSSDSTISEIAYQLGFEHPPYFSRLFKKKTGKTPVQFRTPLN